MGILAILCACGSQQQHDTQIAHTEQVSTDSASHKTPAATDTAQVSNEPVRGISDYDKLKLLAGKNVFSTLHSKLVATLPDSLKEVFKNSPDLDLLTSSKGNLFLNDKEDYAFVVYNKKKAGIELMVYDALANKFSALYSDIKVENELPSHGCGSAIDTLTKDIEYKIGEQSDDMVKEPAKYLETPAIKIADISKDKDILIKDGCMSKRTTKADCKNALCIATSSVYNNWTCIRYDKAKNSFVVFFSQVFAD
ncbi:hypothetical protein A3860_37100 [Niastella vici]|uniref:Uncharacterized protein n=2 Tax=Niastella vici TaxID=1703345 RepID=A0A1V9FMQ1_9BACT|nr:hypothetical protein A3860_37100 [Niastella vici]